VTAEWPIDQLDVAELTARGWRPHPFRQVVLKVHSRCDLACDYCFIYAMSDVTWRSRPPAITPDAIRFSAHRIAEHCRTHQLTDFSVVLHGGEPLLAGPAVIRTIAQTLRSELPADTTLDLRLQTNGVRLDRPMLDLLRELDVKIGMSLDGNERQHDRHRRSVRATGTYQKTARALRMLSAEPYRESFAGLLCVIDLDNDPVETYEALLSFAPPAVDFLLPHGNWTVPPPRRPVDERKSPYGDWLVTVFDRWYDAPEQETAVRTFQEIMNLALGGASNSEQIGLTPVTLVVIDTDGSLEQVDALRSVHHGAAATGLTVFDHDFDDLLSHPAIVARQIGTEALADSCRRCQIHTICGGGYYPHRYRHGNGFHNPSVYCPDLTRLIEHIVGRMRADVTGLLERTP
jgi:uncharacterized protein